MTNGEKFKEVFGFGADGSRVIAVNAIWWDRDFQNSKPFTHADRIRAMSDKELAIILAEGCHNTRECPTICAPIYPFDEVVESCAKCWLEWLKQEVDE